VIHRQQATISIEVIEQIFDAPCQVPVNPCHQAEIEASTTAIANVEVAPGTVTLISKLVGNASDMTLSMTERCADELGRPEQTSSDRVAVGPERLAKAGK
jgi:hypothetical protein